MYESGRASFIPSSFQDMIVEKKQIQKNYDQVKNLKIHSILQTDVCTVELPER